MTYLSLFTKWLTVSVLSQVAGENNHGQLGVGSTQATHQAVKVEALTRVKSLIASGSYSLFLKDDTTLWAAGNNEDGQLGDGGHSSKEHFLICLSLHSCISALQHVLSNISSSPKTVMHALAHMRAYAHAHARARTHTHS